MRVAVSGMPADLLGLEYMWDDHLVLRTNVT